MVERKGTDEDDVMVAVVRLNDGDEDETKYGGGGDQHDEDEEMVIEVDVVVGSHRDAAEHKMNWLMLTTEQFRPSAGR